MAFCAKAYAKINLFLNVIGKRPDGYHEIDTLMHSVGVYDDVILELTDSDITVECDNNTLSGEDNIAAKACKVFFEFAGLNCGAKIRIVKRIPIAAGMGGGSADAAAVLLLLNSATGKNYPICDLLPLAKSLGADVPFFLLGGAARAQGIGEVLTSVESAKIYMVLLKEGNKQSTGHMYSVVDSADIKPKGSITELINALRIRNVDGVCANIFNSFCYCWNFEEMCEPFKSFSPKTVFLSGSGPTVGAIFENESDAKKCADSLITQGYNAFFTETVDTGVEIV